MDTSIKDCATEVFNMSRKFENTDSGNRISWLFASLIMVLVSGMALAAPGSASDGTEGEARASISRHNVRGGRVNPTEVAETTEDYGALITAGERNKADTRGGMAKPGAGAVGSRSGSFDFWIYEADVILFNDDDADGYYHGIDLLFDADTIYSSAEVYAVLYLSLEGGPWNEYAVTEDFTIFGASGSDEYVLVSELMSGYPTGSYDLLIEVFDAYTGDYLAGFGPDESSELAYLPLEDFDRDAPIEEVRVVVSQGGGGAVDGWLLGAFLLILLAGALRKSWRRRNDMLVRIDSPARCWQDGTNNRG
jgi:hypothetical protein